jgi:hypothetical protein
MLLFTDRRSCGKPTFASITHLLTREKLRMSPSGRKEAMVCTWQWGKPFRVAPKPMLPRLPWGERSARVSGANE